MTTATLTPRLAKTLGMLGSSYDGEALAAARAAEMIRKQMGVQWDELLRSGAAVDNWRAACAHCMRHSNRVLTPWEMAFCNKIAGYVGTPTSKQQAILRVLFDRVLAATARAA